MNQQALNMNQQVFKSLNYTLKKIKDDVDFIKNKFLMKRRKVSLRDPVNLYILNKLILNAGSYFERMVISKKIQLRLTYLVLYFSGLRLNEVRQLTYADFQQIIQTGEFNIYHSKTNIIKKHYIHQKGRQMFKQYEKEIDILFNEERFQFLGSSARNRTILTTPKKFITFVNTDIKYTLKKFQINQNIKTHSFRIAFITKLLKITTLQNVSEIVGHKSVSSTMIYNRFNLSLEDKEKIFKNAFDDD